MPHGFYEPSVRLFHMKAVPYGVKRGATALHIPRGMFPSPGPSLLSAGSAEAALTSVRSPVFASSDSVVTVAVSSFSR